MAGVRCAAIVLAGGRGARLGGVDKAAVPVDGRPLVDHVFAAVSGLMTVAVGPDSLARSGVVVVREQPPFAGPAAAVGAGLAAVGADFDEVWLLACDLPRAHAIVAGLGAVPIAPNRDAVVLCDRQLRMQWLAGRYRVSALRGALAALNAIADAPLRAVTTQLSIDAVDDVDGASIDLDTWDDIAAYRDR